MKKRFLTTILIGLLLVTTGCSFVGNDEPYGSNYNNSGNAGTGFFAKDAVKMFDREHVDSYIKEEIGLDDYTLAEKSKKYGGNDAYWEVRDNNAGIDFYVIDFICRVNDYKSSNKLIDNYNDVLFSKVIYDNDKRVTVTKANGTYKQLENFDTYEISCEYTSQSELKDIIDLLYEYKSNADKYSSKFCMSIKFKFVNGISNKITYADTLNTTKDEMYFNVWSDFVMIAYMYDIQECLVGVTQEDIEYAASKNGTLHYARVNEDSTIGDDYQVYVDLTYSNLYKILIAENVDVQGDSQHFKVKNNLGVEYEFSYDFVEYSDKYNENYSYWLENGEKKIDRANYMTVKNNILNSFGIYVEKYYIR